MSDATKDDILSALANVHLDSSGTSVIQSGRIQGLVVKNGNVGFAIEVSPDEVKQAESLRKACEDAVYTVKGVLSVTAALTAHNEIPSAPPPQQAVPKQTPRGHAQAGQSPMNPQPIPGIKKIIAVASGKGGVGKSTLSVNLALGLAKNGLKVGLLDADIYGPSLPRMLGLSGKPNSDGKKLDPMDAYGLKTMSIGVLVDEDTPMIWRGPMVMSAIRQMLNDVRWGELDVLVVDMPPGTGDAQLTMVQNVPLAGVVIVSTPQDVALIDARKGIKMFEKTDAPIIGIVENMSYFISPESGEKSYIFGEGGAKRLADELGCAFLGDIPLHMSIRETSDAGTPVLTTSPNSEEAIGFQQIADQVARALS